MSVITASSLHGPKATTAATERLFECRPSSAARLEFDGGKVRRVAATLKAWRRLKSIGVSISEVVLDGEVADEVRYSISGLPVEADANGFAHAVRSHWSVENGCH